MSLNVKPPETATGTFVESVVPLPSSPKPLNPQQNALRAFVSARVWRAPAGMRENVSDPLSGTGTLLFVFEPLPSCPEALLPQQYAAPDVTNPHTCPAPPPTAA